jgi:putative acetyltransferase
MALQFTKTNSSNPDYQALIKLLDTYLLEKDGDEHEFFAQFNQSDNIKNIIVVYVNDIAVACGAIKEYSSDTMEVKRMYVQPEVRGKGIASMILNELETWTKDLGYTETILETNRSMQNAIDLYLKNGYKIIENYGQYIGVANSVCMGKRITP